MFCILLIDNGHLGQLENAVSHAKSINAASHNWREGKKQQTEKQLHDGKYAELRERRKTEIARGTEEIEMRGRGERDE